MWNLFLKSDTDELKEHIFAHHLLTTIKKNLQWSNHTFLKKKNTILTLTILKNSFSCVFVCTWKKLPLMARVYFFFQLEFSICWPKLRFQALVFYFFFIFQKLVLKSDSDQLKELFYVHLLILPRKKNILLWRVHAILKKNYLPFFTQTEISIVI